MNEEEREAFSQMRDDIDTEELFRENFTEAVDLFGNVDFLEWLGDAEAACEFADVFDEALDFCAFADSFDEANEVARCLVDSDCAMHPIAKKFFLQAAKAVFSDAFERLCTRYDVSVGVTIPESVETVLKLQRENRTARLGAVLVYWYLYDRLDGDNAKQKIDVLAEYGVRL